MLRIYESRVHALQNINNDNKRESFVQLGQYSSSSS